MIHPLFPDRGELNITRILLTRYEAGGVVYCPQPFDPDELQSLEMIQEQFGGGVYELIARDDAKILARQKYKLGGPMKPLHPQPDAPAPAAVPVPVVMHQGGGGDASAQIAAALLQLIPSMMAAQTQQQQSMAQMFAAQSLQQTQFLTAMMTSSKQDGQALVQAMAELSKAQTSTMAEAMKAAAGAGGGGGNSRDDLLETLTTGIEMGAKMADKPNEIVETLGAAVQGMQALSEIKKTAPAGTNGAPVS